MLNQPGPGVDAQGHPVRDPTENVLRDLESAVRRLDDLRDMESRHIRDLMARDTAHAAEIRVAEAARLDALRLVDVNAVQRAAEVQATAVLSLANAAAAQAETLRTQAAATQSAFEARLAAAVDPLMTAVAELQRAQSQLTGARESTREGAGDRRSSVGLIVAAAGLASAILFSVVGVALTLLLKS